MFDSSFLLIFKARPQFYANTFCKLGSKLENSQITHICVKIHYGSLSRKVATNDEPICNENFKKSLTPKRLGNRCSVSFSRKVQHLNFHLKKNRGQSEHFEGSNKSRDCPSDGPKSTELRISLTRKSIFPLGS